MSKPTKYVYQIRSRNGVVVNNLQIYGQTEDEARQKLMRMYPHCQVLEHSIAIVEHSSLANYEDILDIIIKT